MLPVDALDFARPDQREEWIRDRNLRVFSMRDPVDPLIQVDLFARNPIPFDDLLARSVIVPIGGVSVSIAGIDDLIALKRVAGRPQDAADVTALIRIRDARS
ncbi:MAG: hypothetical protein ACRDRT_07250 [Pseudonocardiaceae bacterium]